MVACQSPFNPRHFGTRCAKNMDSTLIWEPCRELRAVLRERADEIRLYQCLQVASAPEAATQHS